MGKNGRYRLDDFELYQDAREFRRSVSRLIRQLPRCEQYCLDPQMRRAADGARLLGDLDDRLARRELQRPPVDGDRRHYAPILPIASAIRLFPSDRSVGPLRPRERRRPEALRNAHGSRPSDPAEEFSLRGSKAERGVSSSIR